MEFGDKIRVNRQAVANHPVGEDFIFTILVSKIIDKIPTKYLKKIFKFSVIDPKDSKSTIKLMNKNLPEHEKIKLNELMTADELEFKVEIKINLK